jgi:hypothetical protein
MKKFVWVGFSLALLGCGGSDSTVTKDAGADLSRDVVVAPDLSKKDLPVNPTDAPDRVDGAADHAPDDVARPDAAVDAPDAPNAYSLDAEIDLAKLDLRATDTDRGETQVDLTDGASVSEVGDRCACAGGSGVSNVSWSCFCSVESCARSLDDFVDVGDGGKIVKSGHGTVLVTEYAGCDLVLVQAKTYSDYVPASEYIFNRTTGALLGAKVWLDDRQHLCPFASSDARWVFGYQSGNYPVPSSCQLTDCLAGSGTCPTVADAQ